MTNDRRTIVTVLWGSLRTLRMFIITWVGMWFD